jgi:hypothetical protein
MIIYLVLRLFERYSNYEHFGGLQNHIKLTGHLYNKTRKPISNEDRASIHFAIKLIFVSRISF